MATYTQLRFSRSDGRSWTTGVAGTGLVYMALARKMAKELTTVGATTHIEVLTEDRRGADSTNTKTHKWSKTQGWH